MDWRWTDSLGVALLGHGLPGRTTDWARVAERAGLGSLWVIEDYFHPGAYALAAAAAAVTERLVIGLGVVNPYTRHPALLAMETAALAGIAPGRIVLGLGSSNRKWIEAQPVPILLGVKGPRALALAAEMADGVHCSILASPAHVRRVRATTASRQDFKVIAYVPVAVSDDGGAQARAWMRPLVARALGALHGQSILADAGLDATRTQPFRDALPARRPASELVTDELMDAVAVAGTPAECRAALARWAEAGLDSVVAVVPEGADLTRQIEYVGRELAPAWKEMQCR